jgi:transposase-like protein
LTLLCAYAGGTYVCVPNRRRSPAIKRRIIELLTEGASPEEIARDCECTERYVFAVAARTQSNQRLMPLPGLG